MAITSDYILNEALVEQIRADLQREVNDAVVNRIGEEDVSSMISLLRKYAENNPEELKAAVIGIESLLSFIVQLGPIDSRRAEESYALWSSAWQNDEDDNFIRWLPEELVNEVFVLLSDRILLLDLLLENGLAQNIQRNVNIADSYGDTPLHKAIRNFADPLIVDLLVQNGADISQENFEGEIPLRLAYCIDQQNQLLAHSKFVEQQPILHYLIKHMRSRRELLKFVLEEKGRDVNQKNSDGKTPLHLAVENKDQEIVDLLTQRGADVNIKDSNGRTPLHLAVIYHDQEMAGLLIKNGAKVNEKDSDGKTPLHLAAQDCKQEMVDLLIQKGANGNIKDFNGNTSLHLLFQLYVQRKKRRQEELWTEVQNQDFVGVDEYKFRLLSEFSEKVDLSPFEIYISKTDNGLKYIMLKQNGEKYEGLLYDLSIGNITEDSLGQHKKEIFVCLGISKELNEDGCEENFYNCIDSLIKGSIEEENELQKLVECAQEIGYPSVIALVKQHMKESCRNEMPSGSSVSSNPYAFISSPDASNGVVPESQNDRDSPKISPR